MMGHTNHTTFMTVVSSNPMALLSKGMGVQEAHKGPELLIETIQIRENVKGKFLPRKFARK
jgi:hypothetical protein